MSIGRITFPVWIVCIYLHRAKRQMFINVRACSYGCGAGSGADAPPEESGNVRGQLCLVTVETQQLPPFFTNSGGLGGKNRKKSDFSLDFAPKNMYT